MYKLLNSTQRLLRNGFSSIRHVRSVGQRPPIFPDDDDKPPTEFEKRLAADKEKLKWRDQPGDSPNYWKSRFTLFAPERENMDLVTFLNQPIDLSLNGWKERRKQKRIKTERLLQSFIPERHQILGNDLAAAHFIVYRNGQIK